MTISAGARLGPYEVVAPIGAGGMGEGRFDTLVRQMRRRAGLS